MHPWAPAGGEQEGALAPPPPPPPGNSNIWGPPKDNLTRKKSKKNQWGPI